MLRISPLWSSLGPKMLKYLTPQTLMLQSVAPRVEIEEMLGVRVHVERAQRAQVGLVGELRFEAAVRRGGRSVNEPRALR